MPKYPLPCQLMFGNERGDQIREQIEEATGQTCPCLFDEPCLLVAVIPRLAVV